MKKITLNLVLIFATLILHAQWEVGISTGCSVIIKNDNVDMLTNEKMDNFDSQTLFYTFSPEEKVSETIQNLYDINLFGNKFLNIDLTYSKKKFFISNTFLFQFHNSSVNENKYKKEEYYYYNDLSYDYAKTEYSYSNATTMSYSLNFGMGFQLGKFTVSPFAGISLTRISYKLYGNIISFYANNSKSYITANYKNILWYIQPDAGIKLTLTNANNVKIFTKFSFMRYSTYQFSGQRAGIAILVHNSKMENYTIVTIDRNGNTEHYDYEGKVDTSPDMFKFEKLSLNIELGIAYPIGNKKKLSVEEE